MGWVFMEALLHYCWKHRILPLGELFTTDGRRVEVIDPGLLNRDAGPDFFNAKVRIGGVMWVGNVEMHIDAQDWFRHGHDKDKAYDNVILHVVTKSATGMLPACGGDGADAIPELLISIPQNIKDNYRELLSVDSYPPCYKVIPELPSLKVHSWMAALQTERLQQKTIAIEERLQLLNGDWEHTYFVTLARSMGFGSNGDALEMWARDLNLKAAAHHRDDLMQVEALFLGQAGLIRDNIVLQNEYNYLKHKFNLNAHNNSSNSLPVGEGRGEALGGAAYSWKFMRMRPQNFPDARIRLLARLYHENRTSLAQLLECKTVQDMRQLFANGLSVASLNVLMINCLIPILFAYGRKMNKEELCERAFDLMESLKPENNNITRMWQEVGLEVRSAGDSQALIQLKKQYCDRKDCLRCRFGYAYMGRK